MIAEQKRTVWVVVALTAAGIGAVTARSLLAPNGKPIDRGNVWRLQYDVRIRATKPGGRVRVALPDNTAACRIQREFFARAGLAMDVARGMRTQGRTVVIVPPADREGARFAAEFDVQVNRDSAPSRPPKQPLSKAERLYYLRAERSTQTDDPQVRRTQALLAKGNPTAARLLQAIYLHCCTSLETDDALGRSDAAGAISDGLATPLGRARAMIALCRVSGLPARAVTGFVLGGEDGGDQAVWVEVHEGQRWVPYDPERGYAADLPPYYLPVRRDGVQIVRATGEAKADAVVTAYLVALDLGTAPGPKSTISALVDLSRLPLGMQHTLAVLLLLPAGALITAVFRNVIGLQTFGTFTPTLLALSFLYSDVWTGLVVFVLVMTIGLALRGLLEKLKLLLVPRLSVVLTVVILCLAMAVSILDFAGLTPSARAVILPLVIMTMMIERFYVTREEDSLANALKLLAGTLVVAACCLVLLRWEELGRLALRFPECQLLVAAGLLLVGRYSGYRLSELLRFRDLTREGPVRG